MTSPYVAMEAMSFWILLVSIYTNTLHNASLCHMETKEIYIFKSCRERMQGHAIIVFFEGRGKQASSVARKHPLF